MKQEVHYIDPKPFAQVFIGCTTSKERLLKEIDDLRCTIPEEDKEIIPFKGAVLYHFDRGEDTILLLYFNIKAYKKKKIDLLSFHALIVHEISHLWQYILKHIREGSPGEEITAYFQQYYFIQIAKYLHQKLGKRLKL